MVVQVGDKVLVYGAGTPWAFAKKIEPVEVGDKVDVVTLSDGTKLAMPKIELDLSEYVWVVPEFDTPFNIGEVPFQWGMMPLGAAVFTVTDTDCQIMIDDKREWVSAELSGCLFIPITGMRVKEMFEIVTNGTTTYLLKPPEDPPGPRDQGLDYLGVIWAMSLPAEIYSYLRQVAPIDAGGVVYFKCVYGTSASSIGVRSYIQQPMNVSGVRQIKLKLRGWTTNCFYWNFLPWAKYQVSVGMSGSVTFSSSPAVLSQILCGGDTPTVGAEAFWANDTRRAALLASYNIDTNIKCKSNWSVFANPGWPNYDEVVIDVPAGTGDAAYNVMFTITAEKTHSSAGADWAYHELYVWVDSVHFYDENGDEILQPCIGGILTGDKYVIYNPTTKRLVFNDATKSLTASNWQTGGDGAEISSSPIDYVWDGQGYVYLTSSKTTFSTIQFDDLLQVQAVHGETVRTIAYHLGERIEVSGETVSRELTNVTSILRAGKNTITLTAKNQDGTKVGFVTAVYVKRNMTAVSL